MHADISTSDSTFTCGAGDVAIHTARPSGDGPFPGVVVFHEAFGLNDDIKRIADRFARHGYLAIAPDLIGSGFGCLVRTFRDLARGNGTSFDKARATIDHIASLDEVDEARLGLAGFCMGGDFALLLGIDDRIKVTAPNYGKAPAEDHLTRLCPVVASYGAKDKVFRGNAGRLEQVLTAAGIDHDVKLYPEAGHSFINDYAPWYTSLMGPIMAVGYHHDEAEDAWSRILTFFGRHLARPAS